MLLNRRGTSIYSRSIVDWNWGAWREPKEGSSAKQARLALGTCKSEQLA